MQLASFVSTLVHNRLGLKPCVPKLAWAPRTVLWPHRSLSYCVCDPTYLCPTVCCDPYLCPTVCRDPYLCPAVCCDPYLSPTVCCDPYLCPTVCRDPYLCPTVCVIPPIFVLLCAVIPPICPMCAVIPISVLLCAVIPPISVLLCAVIPISVLLCAVIPPSLSYWVLWSLTLYSSVWDPTHLCPTVCEIPVHVPISILLCAVIPGCLCPTVSAAWWWQRAAVPSHPSTIQVTWLTGLTAWQSVCSGTLERSRNCFELEQHILLCSFLLFCV